NTHNQWSVWELENAKSLATQAAHKLNELPIWDEIKLEATDPDNYISGLATNHYELYEHDFDIVAKMNMTIFRFSIEWSRIEPEEGSWNVEAIEHYRQYLQALQKRKIEPMVTLMHWTLPVWFTQKGGFEKRSNIKYFVRFAKKVLDELGQDFRYVCVLNEPEAYTGEGYIENHWPPGKSNRLLAFWVYMNLAAAHRQVYRVAKKTSRRFYVGLSKDVAHHQGDDDKILTRLSVRLNMYITDYLFLGRVRRQLDWLGLNFYFSYRYKGFERVGHDDIPINDLGWEMRPQDMQYVLERLHKKYKKPLIVTESGVADRGDKYRKWWITHSIIAIHRAIQKGVVVEGYIHWSLLDNFEWAYGKWPHFGLFKVDYKTFKRTARPSALWFARIIKELRGL
ncbi:MAG TPA: family 1 glycosylhydrolase, partial [Candidatus Saccharimonadales bacterium]|nr:family 1 glycosylhydrolase [Candidatus Saccharimonadales bacterium]